MSCYKDHWFIIRLTLYHIYLHVELHSHINKSHLPEHKNSGRFSLESLCLTSGLGRFGLGENQHGLLMVCLNVIHSSGVNHFEHVFFGPESFWPTVISVIYLHGRYPTIPLIYLPTTHRPTMPVL